METIALLQTALADEYLATIQYHLGAKLAKNAKLKKELAQHAKEELRHADLLARRIIVLDGTPAPKSMWKTLSFCGYTAPGGTDKQLVRQNITGEECAIGYYTKVLNKLEVDSRTKDVVAHILEREYEHLYDLTDVLSLVLISTYEFRISNYEFRKCSQGSPLLVSKRVNSRRSVFGF